MNLTDEELEALHAVLYDEVYYGDDDVVYGEGGHAVNLRAALAKVEAEREGRDG